MSDPLLTQWANDNFMAQMRMEFMARPVMVTKRRGDHHARMTEHWIDRVHGLSRGGYTENPGFARPADGGFNVYGREKPYGWASRAYWKYMRLAIRSAFLAGWHDSHGTTYQTPADSNRRKFAAITGITA